MKNCFLLAIIFTMFLIPLQSSATTLDKPTDDLASVEEALLPLDDCLYAAQPDPDNSLPGISHASSPLSTSFFTKTELWQGADRHLVKWNGGIHKDFNPWSFIVVPFDTVVSDYPNNMDFNALSLKWNWMQFSGRWSEELQDYSNLGADVDDLPGNRDPAFQELNWRTNYINGMHFFIVGMLAMLPNDFTNWSDDSKSLSGAWDRWKENVKAGPVWDEDDSVLNWVAHPWMGSGYYVMARHAGMSKWDSFLYSAFASTILWEYGIEAIAEVPSKQDLLITPIIGSLMGEWAMRTEAWIKKNDRKCWHSKKLGAVVLWLLNPFHIITSAMSNDWNRMVPGQWKTEFFRDIHTYPESLLGDAGMYERNIEREEIWGLRWKSRF